MRHQTVIAGVSWAYYISIFSIMELYKPICRGSPLTPSTAPLISYFCSSLIGRESSREDVIFSMSCMRSRHVVRHSSASVSRRPSVLSHKASCRTNAWHAHCSPNTLLRKCKGCALAHAPYTSLCASPPVFKVCKISTHLRLVPLDVLQRGLRGNTISSEF